MPYQGGTLGFIKSFPCAENFFLCLTEHIFVICNIKVLKTTEIPMITCILKKTWSKKYSRYIPSAAPALLEDEFVQAVKSLPGVASN